MFKKLSTIAASLVLAASVTVTGFVAAEAGDHHHRHHRNNGAIIGGAALGLFALGAMSARSSDDGERCYRGPRKCRWVRGACYRDRFGDYECEEGHEECYRPRYCD
jgi:hypothetical protein